MHQLEHPDIVCQRHRKGTDGKIYLYTYLRVITHEDGSWSYQREYIEVL